MAIKHLCFEGTWGQRLSLLPLGVPPSPVPMCPPGHTNVPNTGASPGGALLINVCGAEWKGAVTGQPLLRSAATPGPPGETMAAFDRRFCFFMVFSPKQS